MKVVLHAKWTEWGQVLSLGGPRKKKKKRRDVWSSINTVWVVSVEPYSADPEIPQRVWSLWKRKEYSTMSNVADRSETSPLPRADMSVVTLRRVVSAPRKGRPSLRDEVVFLWVIPELCQNYFLNYLKEKRKIWNWAVVVYFYISTKAIHKTSLVQTHTQTHHL